MKRLVLMAVCLAVLTATVFAQRTIPMSLRTMVKQAGTVVHGRVTATRTGKDPVTGLLCTWVTMEVRENFYGAQGSSLTFKILGGEGEGMAFKLADMPRFVPSEEAVLLLYPPHPKSGLTSPVGMGQGKFAVRLTSVGKVARQTASSGLMKRSAVQGEQAGDVSLRTLSDDLRRIVAEVKGRVGR